LRENERILLVGAVPFARLPGHNVLCRTEQPRKRLLTQRGELELASDSLDRRRSRGAVDKRQLAKVVAFAVRGDDDVLEFAGGRADGLGELGSAGFNDVELFANVALTDDFLVQGVRARLESIGDLRVQKQEGQDSQDVSTGWITFF
jgi:hypothetical protein